MRNWTLDISVAASGRSANAAAATQIMDASAIFAFMAFIIVAQITVNNTSIVSDTFYNYTIHAAPTARAPSPPLAEVSDT